MVGGRKEVVNDYEGINQNNSQLTEQTEKY